MAVNFDNHMCVKTLDFNNSAGVDISDNERLATWNVVYVEIISYGSHTIEPSIL